MAADTEDAQEIRTYTLGRPPQKTGLGGLSMRVTIMVGATFLITAFLINLGSGRMALTVGVIGGVMTGLVHYHFGPRTIAANLWLGWKSRTARKRGENLYVSGPDSRVPGGEYRPQGALARPELVRSEDSTGRPYALMVDRANNRATIFLSLLLSGDTDRTRSERDNNTADWGRFEAGLSLAGDVVGAVTVLSTRPATGQLAEREVTTQTSEDAPELIRKIQMESATGLSQSGGELEAHMAITYAVSRSGPRDDSFITNLDYTLPNVYPQLSWAGIEADPMDYEAVVARKHSFVDPSTEVLFEQARVEGKEHGMRWEDSGASWALEARDRWYHESCYSVTWEMTGAPASTFEDRVLKPLASNNANVPRGRLCLIYEPISADKGTKTVEKEYTDALAGMNSSKKITKIGSSVRAEETNRARQEVARGAQLGLRSALFTATIAPGEDGRKARSAVKQAAAQSSIKLEEYKDMHDVGFAMSMGMGQTPSMQKTIPKFLQ